MTIQELIKILSAYPQASKVIFNDDDKIRVLKIAEIDYLNVEEMPELCDRPPLGDVVVFHLRGGSDE